MFKCGFGGRHLKRHCFSVLNFFIPLVVWCGVVWCGVVWCGVVKCGVVKCGVVKCGVVCNGHTAC
jgi:hypothetical protein